MDTQLDTQRRSNRFYELIFLVPADRGDNGNYPQINGVKIMIIKLPTFLFLVCMVPFFSLSLSIFGIVPDFFYSPWFSDLVFDGFRAAAMFAFLAFCTLPLQE